MNSHCRLSASSVAQVLHNFIRAGFAGCQPLSAGPRGVVRGMCIADAKLAELEPLCVADAVQMLVSTYDAVQMLVSTYENSAPML